MSNSRLSRSLTTVWLTFWALFINIFVIWVINPLVQDLAMYGVIAVVLIVILWLVTIHPKHRRSFVSFTLYSLMIGQGIAGLTFSSTVKSTVLGIVMVIGLMICAIWFGKARFLPLFFGMAAIVVANLLLPIANWPFLTQFQVLQDARLQIDEHELPSAPFEVIHTTSGDSIVTVSKFTPPKDLLQQLVTNATDSPNALAQVLQSSKAQYKFKVIHSVNGRIVETDATPSDLAQVNPLKLIRPVFPYETAKWYVNKGQLIQYFSHNLSSSSAVSAAVDPASYARTMDMVSSQAAAEQLNTWDNALSQLGVKPNLGGWQITNGLLKGTIQGKSVSIPTTAVTVVGQGHFTSPSANELLLLGNNQLQVLDLSTQQVVATYHGTPDQPIPNDIVIGPLTKGSADAVFVNATPAYVLTVNAAGEWKQVYQAPSQSFRFETVMNQSGQPEIITNDPSLLRNDPTRYLSAYRYSNGQLIRDWRVFRTNVVNVTPVTFGKSNQKDLAVDIYGTGEYLILHKSNVPVVPLTVIVFLLTLVGGLFMRLRRQQGGGLQ